MEQASDLLTTVKDGKGWKEVSRGYTETRELGGGIVIPSHAGVMSSTSGPDDSGLQLSGFDPTSPGLQLVDPGEPGGNYLHDPASGLDPRDRDANIRYMLRKSGKLPEPPAQRTSSVQRSVVQEEEAPPSALVYLHFPGVKIPYNFRDIEVNLAEQKLVLVSDLHSAEQMPEFEPTEGDNLIAFSFPKQKLMLLCSFFNQTCTVLGRYKVTFMVIRHHKSG